MVFTAHAYMISSPDTTHIPNLPGMCSESFSANNQFVLSFGL